MSTHAAKSCDVPWNGRQLDKGGVQRIPVVDSPNNDAFEAIVELYYQSEGFITSSGKWFWAWKAARQQRGHQDLDVLAINGDSTVIVSVTTNLDDKVSVRDNAKSADKLDRLESHFKKVEAYLSHVLQYRWLLADGRKRHWVVAYINGFKREGGFENLRESLRVRGIEILAASEIMEKLVRHANQDNMKTQNQMLKTIHLLNQMGLIKDQKD